MHRRFAFQTLKILEMLTYEMPPSRMGTSTKWKEGIGEISIFEAVHFIPVEIFIFAMGILLGRTFKILERESLKLKSSKRNPAGSASSRRHVKIWDPWSSEERWVCTFHLYLDQIYHPLVATAGQIWSRGFVSHLSLNQHGRYNSELSEWIGLI